MKDAVARVHDQGGIAIVAHPLVPYPLCASEGTIRQAARLGRSAPPPGRHRGVQPHHGPDALVAARAGLRGRGGRGGGRRVGRASGGPHRAGRRRASRAGPPADLRAAIAARTTSWEGEGYAWTEQLGMFRRQTAKNLRAVRDEVAGKVRRNGTGRDLGYPGGRQRPVRFDAQRPGCPRGTTVEDRPGHAVHLPAAGWRERARPGAVREPRAARPRRAHHLLHPRAAALQRGRHHPPGLRLERAHQRVGRDAHRLPPVRPAGPGDAGPGAVRPHPLPRAVRALPVAPGAAALAGGERGHVPRLLRLEPVVRVRQADDGPLRVAAPRPHRGLRRGAPLHQPLLPGRVQGHPQRRGPARLPGRDAVRALARRDAQHPVHRPVREPQGR